MSPLRRVAELEDGAAARVEGVVRAATELLRSPLLGRDCVYWEVRRGLGHAPERFEATWFWLEDATGRVLVRADALDVDVRAERTKEVLETVAADHQALSQVLQGLKQQLKTAQGEEYNQLQKRRRELAKVATFLLAVRAHARGRLHLGGMTLAQQGRWIEENAPAQRPAEGGATIAMAVDRYEVVLAPGDTVVAEGVVATEPVPASMAVAGGYRDAPTARVLGPGDGGVVRLVGVGASQPQPPPPPDEAPPPRRGSRGPGGKAGEGRPAFERVVIGVVVGVFVVAAYLWLFNQ